MDFDLLSAPVSRTSTLIKVATDNDQTGQPTQVWIAGTGFTFDANGLITGGRITSMRIMDISHNPPTAVQTFEMPGGMSTSALVSHIGTAKNLRSQLDAWNLQFADNEDDSGPDVLTDNSVTFTLTDGSKVVITIANWIRDADIGTVTSIQHLAANGTTVLHQATGLLQPLGIIKSVFGNNDSFFDLLTAGNNVITGDGRSNWFEGRLGNDTISHTAGTDPYGRQAGVSYGAATAGVNVDLDVGNSQGRAIGSAGTDVLRDIGNVEGSSFNDTLVGSSANNFLRGGAGNDILRGEADYDGLQGDSGNDSLDGGSGNDQFRGGARATTRSSAARASTTPITASGSSTTTTCRRPQARASRSISPTPVRKSSAVAMAPTR